MPGVGNVGIDAQYPTMKISANTAAPITCLLGTRAQIIKMAPVIRELEKRQVSVNLVLTGQHKATMDTLITEFGITSVPNRLYDGPEISSIGRTVPWLTRCLLRLLRERKRFLPRDPRHGGVILVHGDTFSTLLGALAGKLCGLTVGHVESGLRSHNVFHPFPEELTRLAVFRLSDIAFCPGSWALNNLAGYKMWKVDIGGNTLADALAFAERQNREPPHPVPDEAFGVVSLHRFENVFRRARLEKIVELLEQAAARHLLVFVLHPATERNLKKFGLYQRIAENSRVTCWPRVGYFDFVNLMRRSRFVITDGGGNQEELSYLGKPTLLMRRATERTEGLGTTTTLCDYDANRLDGFLDSLGNCSPMPLRPTRSPSTELVRILLGGTL